MSHKQSHLTVNRQVAFIQRVFSATKVLALHSADAQWNCSSSVEPVRALTEDEPPWITVVTSSK